MRAWKRYALFALGTTAMIGAMFAVRRGMMSTPQLDVWIAIGFGVAAATMFAGYQHGDDADRYDERRMYIRYRSAYVAFWAVYMFLFIFAMAGYGGGLPENTYAFVVSAWGLGTVVVGGLRLWNRRKF